jgi:hypothetical protein
MVNKALACRGDTRKESVLPAVAFPLVTEYLYVLVGKASTNSAKLEIGKSIELQPESHFNFETFSPPKKFFVLGMKTFLFAFIKLKNLTPAGAFSNRGLASLEPAVCR